MSLKQQKSWIDARFTCHGSDQARMLARTLRKSGAAHVMVKQNAVWGIWADAKKNETLVKNLATGQQIDRFEHCRFDDPLQVWATPTSIQLGPGLSLASVDSGITHGPDTLIIDPLTAFGSGDHPSTWLNLTLLAGLLAGESGLQPRPGSWAADIGAGTGVLALAMALKGNLQVLAVDPDPAARRACKRNQTLNPLAGPLVSFAQGTHECVKGQFRLVAANLPGPLLIALSRDLAAMVAAGGNLVTSGFRTEAEPDIAKAFSLCGMRQILQNQRLGWSGIIFTTA